MFVGSYIVVKVDVTELGNKNHLIHTHVCIIVCWNIVLVKLAVYAKKVLDNVIGKQIYEHGYNGIGKGLIF